MINTTAIQPHAAETNSGSSSSALPSSGTLNNMFLQLLVAQLKNQSPLNPMDPTQFVGQLAQFSELSEVTSIYQLLQQEIAAGKASGGHTTPSRFWGGSAAGPSSSTAAAAAIEAASQAVPGVASYPTKSFEPRVEGVF